MRLQGWQHDQVSGLDRAYRIRRSGGDPARHVEPFGATVVITTTVAGASGLEEGRVVGKTPLMIGLEESDTYMADDHVKLSIGVTLAAYLPHFHTFDLARSADPDAGLRSGRAYRVHAELQPLFMSSVPRSMSAPRS